MSEYNQITDFDMGLYDIKQKRLFLISEDKETQIINDVKRVWIKYHQTNNVFFILVDFDSPNKPQIYVVAQFSFINPELDVFEKPRTYTHTNEPH